MGGKIIWSEKKIQQLEAAGYGQGEGANYKPWIEVQMVSSLGRSRRVFSPKTGRTHHLLSDVEFNLFLALEWQTDVTDIREQFPLDRDITQDIARQLSVRHPFYPGTHVPTVMTVDFLITRIRDGQATIVAFNAKRTEEAEDERSLEKLEIQRETLSLLEIPHHLVFHSDIPLVNIKNIGWIRDSLVKDGEEEPHRGFWDSMTSRMQEAIAGATRQDTTLSALCGKFDAIHGTQQGTGLRAARMLMAQRVLSADLTSDSLADTPLSKFTLTQAPGQLRAVGGR
jgi:hypothetical protein